LFWPLGVTIAVCVEAQQARWPNVTTAQGTFTCSVLNRHLARFREHHGPVQTVKESEASHAGSGSSKKRMTKMTTAGLSPLPLRKKYAHMLTGNRLPKTWHRAA